MSLLQHFKQQFRKLAITLSLALVLIITSACSTTNDLDRGSSRTDIPAIGSGQTSIKQLERGSTPTGQNFGDWIVQTGQGLIKDAYVRGDDKLGVVISPQVRPNEVKSLARSLVQGFQHQAPNRDLSVFMYAPDKKLILTAKYNNATNQIDYQA